MDAISEYLAAAKPKRISIDSLKVLAKSASDESIKSGKTLNTTLVEKLASYQPMLTYEHIKRACEYANNCTHVKLASVSKDKRTYPSFELAEYDEVATKLAKPQIRITSDYDMAPKTADVNARKLTTLFKHPMTIEGKIRDAGKGDPRQDVKQLDTPTYKTLADAALPQQDMTTDALPAADMEMLGDAKTKLASTLDNLKSRKYFLETNARLASDEFLENVKQACSRGVEFHDIEHVCLKTAALDGLADKAKILLQAAIPSVAEEGVKIASGVPSGKFVDYKHPIPKSLRAYLAISEELEKTAATIEVLEKDAINVNTYIKRALFKAAKSDSSKIS